MKINELLREFAIVDNEAPKWREIDDFKLVYVGTKDSDRCGPKEMQHGRDDMLFNFERGYTRWALCGKTKTPSGSLSLSFLQHCRPKTVCSPMYPG